MTIKDAIGTVVDKHMEAFKSERPNVSAQELADENTRYNKIVTLVANRADHYEKEYESSKRRLKFKANKERFESRLPLWLRPYRFNSHVAGGPDLAGNFYEYSQNVKFNPLPLANRDILEGEFGVLATNYMDNQSKLRDDIVNPSRNNLGQEGLQALKELREVNNSGSGGPGQSITSNIVGMFVNEDGPKMGGILGFGLALAAVAKIWTGGLLQNTGFMGMVLGAVTSVGLLLLGAWAGNGIADSVSAAMAAKEKPPAKDKDKAPGKETAAPEPESEKSTSTEKAQAAAAQVNARNVSGGTEAVAFTVPAGIPLAQQDKKKTNDAAQITG